MNIVCIHNVTVFTQRERDSCLKILFGTNRPIIPRQKLAFTIGKFKVEDKAILQSCSYRHLPVSRREREMKRYRVLTWTGVYVLFQNMMECLKKSCYKTVRVP
ncbi:uncharacterized protein LOC111089243 [Limulus polyphemus]|uniref:Uncharacterized protein LOC111089243 n=1 Tax=Limulus polyphemus TaxID=6850 RepID=A0ABM1TMI9_LIMPO|nr:uncharacterized protein LOC111089243 [Limulus polyphemus]